ncbi:MAG: hypothetical protein MJ131_05460 [Lachnospiraceae bacterium]|nr:hypothetical protein [Lachnospiraceae bacterium]
MKLAKGSVRNILLFLGMFVLGIGVGLIPERFIIYQASNFIFIGIIIGWGLSVRRRAIQDNTRRLLMCVASFLIVLMVLKMLQNGFVVKHSVTDRLMTYGAYVPMIIVPVCSLHAALSINRPEGIRKRKFMTILYLGGTVMSIITMTNDMHQLMLIVEDETKDRFSGGPIYWFFVFWVVSILLGAIYVAFDKCRLSAIKRFIWVPITYGILIGAVFVIFVFRMNYYGVFLLDFQELYSFTIIGEWEVLLQIGLIRSNVNYDLFFINSPIPAQLTDANGTVRYESNNARDITAKHREEAKKGLVFLDDNRRLHHYFISGGSIYWVDDISEITRLNNLLQDVNEQLSEERELIHQENELRAQRISFETQNRLYDHIALCLRPRLDYINELLKESGDEDFDRNLAKVCVIGAYVKRFSNMCLLSDSTGELELGELYLSISESLDNLKNCGVNCTSVKQVEGICSADKVIAAYEFFEAYIEELTDSGCSLMVSLLESGEGFELRMMLDIEANDVQPDYFLTLPVITDFFVEQISDMGGVITKQGDEEGLLIRLRFVKR